MEFIITTTPTIAAYRIVKVCGIVSGLTARTRGMGGQLIGGLQSMVGGEVTAFTSEILKARDESINRAVESAKAMGANAIVGLDLETANLYQSIVLISATGTAVVVTPDVP
ncbi:MAG TPA: YbjQ family protein, partial [Candidatus Methanomethylicus sp.]|nr:YbjQ family protein [Candidatus Methanomethylicus sp.]